MIYISLFRRSHEVHMALRNVGLLPATVRVDFRPSEHFTVACPSSMSLNKGERRSFQARASGIQGSVEIYEYI